MTQTSDYCLVMSTCPDAATAEALAGLLLESGAAACVNIVPGLRSLYYWQGRLEASAETLLLIKTRNDAYPRVESLLRARHPYELPEVVRVPIESGSVPYLDWINSQVKP